MKTLQEAIDEIAKTEAPEPAHPLPTLDELVRRRFAIEGDEILEGVTRNNFLIRRAQARKAAKK